MAVGPEIGARLESWLAEDETDALPSDVLDAVAARLPAVRQLRARPLLHVRRPVAFGLAAAAALLGGAVGLAVLAPPPAPVPDPVGSGSPTPSNPATPLSSPTPTLEPVIHGYVGIGSGMEVDLRGWTQAPTHDVTVEALYEAGICEGASCGLYEIYRHVASRSGSAYLHRSASTATETAVRFEMLDAIADVDALLAAAQALAAESGDAAATVRGPVDLPAGPAAIVRWTLHPAPSYPPISVAQYLVIGEGGTVLATFGVPVGDEPAVAIRPETVMETLRAVGSELRLGLETWSGATRLDLDGWSRPPDGLALAILAAESGGLPGTWELVTSSQGSAVAFRQGLVAVLPTTERSRGPDGVLLVRTYPPIEVGDLDTEAARLAADARGESGQVVEAIQLPVGPARIIRSSLETATHGRVEVIEYVILTSRRLVVLEFGADWRRFDALQPEFLRVATSVSAVEP